MTPEKAGKESMDALLGLLTFLVVLLGISGAILALVIVWRAIL